EQAILCRTHGQAASIARVLEAAGVPTLYLGNLFERPEIRDLLALVSLAAESDGRALLRASRLAGAPIDRLACAALVQWARAQQVPFPRALDRAAEAGLEPAAAAACAALAAAIDAAGPYRDPAGFLARFLFGPASPLGGLLADGSAGAAAQIMAIDQLLGLARSLEAPSAPPPAGTSPDTAPSPLRQFLTHVRRLYAAKQVPGRTPAGGDELAAVRVLTVHASKGLEFPVVYVPCLAAGRFPFREMWEACPPPPGLITGESESDQELEETCLFFVALSRARDELVLSRATRYGKQAAKPSPFLALLAPAFAQQPPQPLTWPAAGAPAAAAPAADSPAPDPETVFDVADLEQYLHCPRQYEYSRRLRLDAGESGGYQSFNKVVREVLRHLRAEHTANRLPAGEAAVLELLAGNWESAGPQGHIHEALYADAARRLVLATWRRLAGTAPTAAWREELTVPLGGATVRARLDLAQRQPGQGIRVVRLRTGKPRDDDRRALRLALIQAAARQELGPTAPLTIELEYLETGETVPVEIAGRYERERLAKLEGAVQGIRAGHFPATPADADACLRCPFWIICPA
ncbi:MAG TPA: 3'-5' exonuclease, partial [Chloroflexia bacterium]|nr:3'-5' exonuclease [Chloroflexia bacterium]